MQYYIKKFLRLRFALKELKQDKNVRIKKTYRIYTTVKLSEIREIKVNFFTTSKLTSCFKLKTKKN